MLVTNQAHVYYLHWFLVFLFASIIGSGGASYAIAYALIHCKVRSIRIKNRSADSKTNLMNWSNNHFDNKTNCATRKASENSLEVFTKHFENLIGGSADLTGSNNT